MPKRKQGAKLRRLKIKRRSEMKEKGTNLVECMKVPICGRIAHQIQGTGTGPAEEEVGSTEILAEAQEALRCPSIGSDQEEVPMTGVSTAETSMGEASKAEAFKVEVLEEEKDHSLNSSINMATTISQTRAITARSTPLMAAVSAIGITNRRKPSTTITRDLGMDIIITDNHQSLEKSPSRQYLVTI